MTDILRGSEALSTGALTRGVLRSRYRRLFPDVYIPAKTAPTLLDRIHAASIWSRGQGVIAGRAAAALHGARWIDDGVPIEMIRRFPRPPHGIIVRNESIEPDEICSVDGVPVTTPQRTAFDLARHHPRVEAVTCLDDLARATGIEIDEVQALADRYPSARLLDHARDTVNLMDGASRTPAVTRVRLILRKCWPMVPRAGVRVGSAAWGFVDLGYEEFKVGVDVKDVDGVDLFVKMPYGTKCRPEIAHKIRYSKEFGWVLVVLHRQSNFGEVLGRVGLALEQQGY
ncbi:type IV toxin-antitoxin system AbiEi family antitoxin [Mycobacterium kyogaense]|uniref:type IV toxin-antitoxin system AbiEi family antitoxin n=1 Tax=Mycobacterium kyogaense TaxID=2212479 RepID=UPI0013C49B94|nr:type IV toxin-antitoxin system AbiEi family antitoxin [Mycobacterium kyogaense]